MRNMLGSTEPVLKRCYLELSDAHSQIPKDKQFVPELLEQVLPLHAVVDVDLYLPGCPPSAQRIQKAIEPLLKGKQPVMEGREMIKFG